MKEIQVDDLQYEGEKILHLDFRDDSRNVVIVKDVRRGDRTKVVLEIEGNTDLTMTMKQSYIDDKSMKLFTLNKVDDPEYYL